MHICLCVIPMQRAISIEEDPVYQGHGELHRKHYLQKKVYKATQGGLEGEEVDCHKAPLGKEGEEEAPVCQVPEIGFPSCVGSIEYSSGSADESDEQPEMFEMYRFP